MNKTILFALLGCYFFSCNTSDKTPKVLVFTKNTYSTHESIPAGIKAISNLGIQNNFIVDTTSDAAYFNDDSLRNYAAVVFLNTSDNKSALLNQYEEAAFERFIQSGGGYAGIHAGSDAEYDWTWYGKLVGAIIKEDSSEKQETVLHVQDTSTNLTKGLSLEWNVTEAWNKFSGLNSDVHILITANDNQPVSWYHDYDGGRAWYTTLGHDEEVYNDPNYLKHVLGGIQYAIGNNKKDYSKAKTDVPPDESHFTKTALSTGEFFEPVEMTVLPNLDVLIVQRRGEILLYKNETKQISQAGFLDVYFKVLKAERVNAEEGLLGICKDPNFEKNHWVYMFYSPADTSVNRLSRFEFKDDKIDMTSEKIVLQFYSQREICCHTGGSIAFGPDGLLYLSTGDNSTPFNAPRERFVNRGYSPMDNRDGLEQYDARRSASNSNDLRGKIIRIKVNDDGSYSIPDGNLFARDQAKTRPEIYAMGTRNAYRLSVDQKNSFVYWGDVGPDARSDSFATRGPRGYDEVNQARKAGYFGWPLFVGNNYPYVEYDYKTGKSGAPFDPMHPVNNSKNNTGITDLPPVSPAFIWYPYNTSPEFPQMGSGGRTAMAGPVYYSDLYRGKKGLPDYYDGKLFIYEWIRNYIKVVTLTPEGDFYKMEPFMEHTKLAAPVDMEMGPDGKLYILEYGLGWFSKNKDSGLSRIDYTE